MVEEAPKLIETRSPDGALVAGRPGEPCPSRGFSVIVPVRNEADVLARFLDALLDGLPADAEVVFSLNGCSDASRSVISGVNDPRIRLVETERPGKAGAIRLAETQTTAFPRFYVDADVAIRGSDLARLTKTLVASKAMMVSPRQEFRYDGATFWARAFNDVWTSSIYIRDGAFQYVIGVSRDGRACWKDMPEVLADDTFMRLSIHPSERVVDDRVEVVVWLPTRFGSIVRVRRRIALGLRQLRAMGYRPREKGGARRATPAVRPSWPKVLIYCLGVVSGRLWAWATPLDRFEWTKDQSSRRI